jgi:hypothetical protein
MFVAASPCTPPPVFSGRLHQVEHTTIADNGNQNVDLHQELFGTLTQQDTGQYAVTSTDEDHFTNAPGPQIENGFGVDFHVQSTGSAPNFLLHENFHFTIDANGQLEAVVDNVNVECTG